MVRDRSGARWPGRIARNLDPSSRLSPIASVIQQEGSEVDLGIGLPNPIPGTGGETLVEWARRAEGAGFSTVATIDRIVYPSYESLIALAAAAAVTDRVALLSNIVIAPLRNEVLLAKEASSVDRLSGGRLTLGLAVGGRSDDYTAVGANFETRGARFARQIETMKDVWRGHEFSETRQPSVPQPGREIPILIGGATDDAIERTVEHGIGYTAGGGGAERLAPMAKKIRVRWREAGRDGEPRIVALTYFALGPRASEGAARYLKDYYGFLGEWADRIAESAPTTPDAIKSAAARFEEIGVDELIFDPTIAELDQVEQLAEVVL
jgi:alkanesulfonate monooxygenase SsuD/methylene tetrahydromethanopterin reductase-like flavin-dependent oxidoreductase (luciferase family)